MTHLRFDELMAAAGLAPSQLARAQQQGANDAAATEQWTGLVKMLPGVASNLMDFGQKSAADDAMNAQKRIIAAHIGDTGDTVTTPTEGPVTESGQGPAPFKGYAQTPGQIAKSSADPLASMADGSWNPFAKDAFDTAQASAESQVAGNVQANRDKQREIDRQASLDAVNTKKANAEIGAANATAARSTAEIGDIGAQQTAREQANKKLARDAAINAAIAPAVAGVSSLGEVARGLGEQGSDITDNELNAAYNAAKTKADAAKAEIGAKGAQAAQGYAAAEKDRAEAEKARREPAGGKLPAEAQMALASTDATMGRLAHVAGLKANFDASNPGLGQGVANAINEKLRSLGADDPQRTQLMEAVKNAWLEWRKDVAGVRWNPEIANMEENVFVKATDNPQTFSGLLANMWNDAATKHNAILGTAQALTQNTGTLANAPMLGNDGVQVAAPLARGDFQ